MLRLPTALTMIALIGCSPLPGEVQVELGPDDATTVDALRLQLTAPTDRTAPDAYAIAWSVDGELIPELADQLEVPPELTEKHQTWTAEVVPLRGSRAGETSTVEITVKNTAPVVELDLVDKAPRVEDDVQVSASVFDPDGDETTLAWRWSVDGTPTDLHDPVLSSAHTTRGQTWTASVIASDGENSGPASDVSVVIANTAPQVLSLALVPEVPTADQDLEVLSESVDADGDDYTLRYVWRIDGELIEHEGPVLPAEYLVRGAEIELTVVPDDGYTVGEASTVRTTVVNKVPQIDGARMDPTAPQKGQTVRCVGEGWSDADDDPERYQTRWSVNGKFVSTHDTLSPEAYAKHDTLHCELTPVDDHGAGSPVQASTQAINSTPALFGAVIDDASPNRNSVVSASAVGVFDADDDEVTVTWAWKVDGVHQADTPTFALTDAPRGAWIEAVATPNDGEEDGLEVASIPVQVQNTPPTVTTVSLDAGGVLRADGLIHASATGADVDGDGLTFRYEWLVDGNDTGATGPTLDGAWFKYGEQVSVQAFANDGFEDSEPLVSTSIEVANSAPFLASVSASPSPAKTTDTLSCTAGEAVDADDHDVELHYAWTVNGAASGTSKTLLSESFVRGDEVICGITPTDGIDEGAEVFSQVITIENSAPSIGLIEIDSPAAGRGRELAVILDDLYDADGDEIDLAYAWYVGGVLESTDATYVVGDLELGTEIYVTVTPSDDAHSGTSVTSETILVENSPPEVWDVTLTPSDAAITDELVASYEVRDADGDEVVVSFIWTVNGSLIDATTDRITVRDHAIAGDDIAVTVTATDDIDESDPVLSPTITIGNTPPEVASASVDPSAPRVADVLSCVDTGAFDEDGDEVSFDIGWYVNSSLVATSPTLSSDSFVKGDSVFCELVPFDGTDLGETVYSPTIAVLNTLPVLASASLDAGEARNGTSLGLVLGETTDADSDEVSLSVAWFVDDAEVASGSTFEVSGVAVGSAIYARVTPSDDEASGEVIQTAAVPVANTAPVLSSVSVNEDTVYADQTLTASYAASDADGHSLTPSYTWLVNGADSGVHGPTFTVASHASKDDEITLRVSVNDGELDSEELSWSRVVQNSAPTDPVVSISPTSPLEGSDDLICSVDTASTDADGDAISYTVTWTVDGAAFSDALTTVHAGDTISGAATIVDEVWVCSVTASDGEISSSAATDSTTVIDWTGERVFTVCDATGRTGPLQADCDSAYTATTLASEVTVSGGIQSWTAPTSGTFKITAYGAQGGYLGGGGGGLGASVAGEVYLEKGDELQILVGQHGGQDVVHEAGGGGGTFVVRADGTPLLVAGGGGAQGGCSAPSTEPGDGRDASTSTSGSAGNTSALVGGGPAGGTDGNGGLAATDNFPGGAGGGFYTGGLYGTRSYGTGCSTGASGHTGLDGDESRTAGGQSYEDGAIGGRGCYQLTGQGGFGGGGGGGGCGGGGGGGWSGGGGGQSDTSGAGGGGSYNSLTSPVNLSGVQLDDGKVTIDLID